MSSRAYIHFPCSHAPAMLRICMAYTTPDQNDIDFLNGINWLPGHMMKAIRDIKNTVNLVDIIIEVRDARVPMVSGNKEIYSNAGDRPYLIVINKTNLADPKAVKLWKSWFTEQKESFIFINALDKSSIKTIIKRSKEVIKVNRKKLNASTPQLKEMSMMILGLPNTGKSTIINKLSKRNATKAAATPGQTTLKLWVKADKDLRILDTPGVMPPVIHKRDHAMWLSAIHAIPDHIITPEYSACFIVEHLLKECSTVFQKFYEIESLDIELNSIVEHIGKRRGCLRTGGGYDYERVYKIILDDFRKGSLGLTSFEFPPIR